MLKIFAIILITFIYMLQKKKCQKRKYSSIISVINLSV